MAIFIRITDTYVEELLMALQRRQTARVSMTALTEAILIKAAEACSGDPEAWKKIGQATASTNESQPTPIQPTGPLPD